MEVSCIIPCRNGAKYVAEAIASAVAEKVAEVIVVDDGSTDGSATAVAAAAGPVRLLAQPPIGAAAARNAGLKAARHGIIAFLDADDLWPAGSLQLRCRALAADRDLAAVYGHVRQFISPELDESQASRIACPAAAMPARTFGSIVFRADVFARIGLLDERLVPGEMFEFMARFCDAGLNLLQLPQTVLLRRLHGANMMRAGGGASQGYPRALKAVLERRRRDGVA